MLRKYGIFSRARVWSACTKYGFVKEKGMNKVSVIYCFCGSDDNCSSKKCDQKYGNHQIDDFTYLSRLPQSQHSLSN